MTDEPSSNDTRTGVLIFVVILVVGLIVTLFFMNQATQEADQTDEAESDPTEDVNSHAPVLPAQPLYSKLA